MSVRKIGSSLILCFWLVPLLNTCHAQAPTLGRGYDRIPAACQNGYSGDCGGAFAGMYDTPSGTYNFPAINGDGSQNEISGLDVHTLLYPPNTSGITTFLAVHYQPWFSVACSPEYYDYPNRDATTGHYSACNGHVEDGHISGYNEEAVLGQLEDMYNRGFDGLVVDWYGSGSADENSKTLSVRDASSETNFPDTGSGGPFCTGLTQCKLLFAIMDDQGSWDKTCPQKATTDQTQCLITSIDADMDYVESNYFNNLINGVLTPVNSYLRVDPSTMRASASGRPVVFFFVDQTAWCYGSPCTPNANWNTVWTSVRSHVAAYPTVGGESNDPLFMFRNASAFTDSTDYPIADGGYAWVGTYKNYSPCNSSYLPTGYDTANDPLGLCYLQQFYNTAAAHSSKEAWGAMEGVR
jgi:hypothetical protein